METVTLFKNTTLLNQSGGSREVREARNAGRLFTLARKGAAGLNPTAVLVDMVASLLDAASAWLRYSAARQETQALKQQLSALEHQLDNDLKLLKIERKQLKEQGDAFRKQVAMALDTNHKAEKHFTRQFCDYKKLLYRLREQLECLRQKQRGTLQEFARLEALLHQAMHQLLACTLQALD